MAAMLFGLRLLDPEVPWFFVLLQSYTDKRKKTKTLKEFRLT